MGLSRSSARWDRWLTDWSYQRRLLFILFVHVSRLKRYLPPRSSGRTALLHHACWLNGSINHLLVLLGGKLLAKGEGNVRNLTRVKARARSG